MRTWSIFFLLLLLPALAANPIKMVKPLQQEIRHGDEVFIGTIGPGQTIDVQVYPYVTEGGIYGKGGQYDILDVTEKPSGWSSEPSKLYGNPLQAKITADKNASEGLYYANITVQDYKDGHKLGNVTFRAKINVTWDVLDVDVKPSHVLVGPEQPAQFKITVVNKGSASDTYTVSAKGAKQWEFVKPIYIPAKSSRTVVYELTAHEEEYYSPEIRVVSASSPNIHAEKNISFTVRSDLLGDYKATNNGVMIFPVFEAPIYSLAGLVAALLAGLGSY